MRKSYEAASDTRSVERIFRLSDLPPLTGYAEDYHWQLIRGGKFPRPIRLGPNSVGWTESAIKAWQEERAAAGYKPRCAQGAG